MPEPLAERMRPTSFDDIVGQDRLFGKNGAVRKMVERGYLTNMIFSGPPGTGKTTASMIIARSSGMRLHTLNATSASLSDVKEVIKETGTLFGQKGVLLYLDEIQYFNKKQQQSLLEFIEDGRITLIASTTENPYYCVYNSLLSRSAVFEFRAVTPEELVKALTRAIGFLNAESGKEVKADPEALMKLARVASGDVRRAINTLENVYATVDTTLTKDDVEAFVPSFTSVYDRNGDSHYDLLSALQKSIRGSDPDAAILYLCMLIENGDMLSACRRLQVIASEDIGLAYPLAPVIVKSCVDSALAVGLPEAVIPLSHATELLATSPKSNSAYTAYAKAKEDITSGGAKAIPRFFQAKYADEYKYPHDYPGHWVKQKYLPDDAKGGYYTFGDNKTEQLAKAYWDAVKNGGK